MYNKKGSCIYKKTLVKLTNKYTRKYLVHDCSLFGLVYIHCLKTFQFDVN